jgi:hypothetical protein
MDNMTKKLFVGAKELTVTMRCPVAEFALTRFLQTP